MLVTVFLKVTILKGLARTAKSKHGVRAQDTEHGVRAQDAEAGIETQDRKDRCGGGKRKPRKTSSDGQD